MNNEMSGQRSPKQAKNLEFDVDARYVPLAPIFIKVERSMNVMDVLRAYALEINLQLMILSAVGAIRDVVFSMNTKIYNEGIYQIKSLSGRIIPGIMGKIASERVNLVMSDINGATVGGVLQDLVAETTVEVVVCPVYNDPSRPHPFDFNPPRLYGIPYLPGSLDPSPSNPISSSDPSPSNPISSREPSPSDPSPSNAISSREPSPSEPSASDPRSSSDSEPSSRDPSPRDPSPSGSSSEPSHGEQEPSSSEPSHGEQEPSSSESGSSDLSFENCFGM